MKSLDASTINSNALALYIEFSQHLEDLERELYDRLALANQDKAEAYKKFQESKDALLGKYPDVAKLIKAQDSKGVGVDEIA